MTNPPIEIPRIISVDDHVVEPPNLWVDRLPAKYQDRCPRVERDRARFNFVGGVFSYDKGDAAGPDAQWGDWWMYDDLIYPFPKLSAALDFEPLTLTPVTFDELRPGCWKQADRLADMDANHVEASLCFPNVLPRFCGQAFLEREDKELALLCVQAYNDWMIDEWCAGDGYGRLIPMTIVPLWDAQLAADEIHRCANKGSFAVSFTENPYPLGLPSIHDQNGFWNPFLQACEDTGTVINMHIGSSSKMPSTSPDAPFAVSSTLTFSNAMGSMVDWILAGVFVRHPNLRIAYSEGQVGWMPYIIDRMDKIWAERENEGADSFGIALPEPPSTYIKDHIWGCVFDDPVGLRNRDLIGMSQITFETDYPHADSTFPHSKQVATEIIESAGLNQTETNQLIRGNAIHLYGLDRWGITS